MPASLRSLRCVCPLQLHALELHRADVALGHHGESVELLLRELFSPEAPSAATDGELLRELFSPEAPCAATDSARGAGYLLRELFSPQAPGAATDGACGPARHTLMPCSAVLSCVSTLVNGPAALSHAALQGHAGLRCGL